MLQRTDRFRRRDGWVALRSGGLLWRRFRLDWGRVPAGARRAWGRRLLLGLVLEVALMTGLVLAARGLERAGRLEWEGEALRGVAAAAPLSFGLAIVVQEVGGPFLLVTLTLLSAAAAAWARRPLRAATVAAAFVGLNPVTLLGWALWSRARPTVLAAGMASPGALHSFPSGHVAHVTAVYGVLFALWFRASGSAPERALIALLLLLVVAVVGVGRLRMGVHWPTDVLAGACTGAVWAVVLVRALARAEALAGRV